MEIVGVIAAVPGLIEMVQAVATAVRGLKKGKIAARITQELISQLGDLEDILQDIQSRWRRSDSQLMRLQRLSPAFNQLRTELSSLRDILLTSKSAKRSCRLLKKLVFLSTRFEKAIEESVSRLSNIKISLTLLIANHQDGLAEEILRLTLNELRLKLQNLLRPSSDNFIPAKTQHTCEWIWSNTTFLDWVNGVLDPQEHLSRTLCLYGIKGCGKSVLVKAVAEQLRGHGGACLHFSFWAGSEAQRKLSDLLRTFCWQILGCVPDESLEQVSKPLINDPNMNDSGLLRIIHGALPLIRSKVYCVIDGMDESLEDWGGQSNSCVSALLDLVKSHVNVYVLLTGREPSLQAFLRNNCPKLEITEDLIRPDIHRVIAAELNDSLISHTPAIKDMIQETLEAKTQVMFLWATLVFKELRRCYSVEEVKQTLNQVPYDLDREYHRLFSQLMARSRGTLARPSLSMKRARYLLYSLIACPEPMTAEDLCYSCAAQVNSGGPIEDDLITADGIMDACGDFVRVTEGRYHLIHASAADFLTRPESEWVEQDSEILYFRVDTPTAQASLSSACLRYVTSLDLGYPLTDNRASSIPSRHAYFSYVIKFLPFHLGRVIEPNGHVPVETAQFMRRPQFCALMEYLIFTTIESLQNNNVDSVYYWVELFLNLQGGQNEDLCRIYQAELQRRSHCFGMHDDRYRSWDSLGIFVPGYGLHYEGGGPLKMSTWKTLSPVKESMALSTPVQPSRQPRGLLIQQLPNDLHTLSRFVLGVENMATNILASLAESLPVPLIVLATEISGHGNNIPLHKSLTKISIRNTEGRGDFYELCSLLLYLNAEWNYSDSDTGEIIRMSEEAVRVAENLPVQPHIQLLKITAYYWLLSGLIKDDKIERAREVTEFYKELLGENRKKCSSHLWEHIACNTQSGVWYRTWRLADIAGSYANRGYYAEADDLFSQAFAVFDESGFKQDPMYFSFGDERRLLLWNNGEYSRCITTTQKLLKTMDAFQKTNSRLENPTIQWRAYQTIADCLEVQGESDEAESWWSKAADEVERLLPDQLNLKMDLEDEFYLKELVTHLISIGQYDRSDLFVRKFIEANGLAKLDDEDDVAFHHMGSLTLKLKELGIIKDSDLIILNCLSLLMRVDDMQDKTAEADWWKEFALELSSNYVEPFKAGVILSYLKSIDTQLELNPNGDSKMIERYRDLALFLFTHGEVGTAIMISSDAESRVVASYHRPWFGHILTSDIAFYNGDLSRRRDLLCKFYDSNMTDNCVLLQDFQTELFLTSELTKDLQDFPGDWDTDLWSSFRRKADGHLARTVEINERLLLDGCSDEDDYHNFPDETLTHEGRLAQILGLQIRLEQLNKYSMIDIS